MVDIKRTQGNQAAGRVSTFKRAVVDVPKGTPEDAVWTVASKQNATKKSVEVLTKALGRKPMDSERDDYLRALASANPQIDLGKILPGDRLVLPKPNTAWAARPPRSGPNAAQIAEMQRTPSPAVVSYAKELSDQVAILAKDGKALTAAQMQSFAATLKKMDALSPEDKAALALHDKQAFINHGKLYQAPGVKPFYEQKTPLEAALDRVPPKPVTKERYDQEVFLDTRTGQPL